MKQFIAIREVMNQVQTVCATAHEIGHAKLQGREAESVSYAVCRYYGAETGENSFDYITGMC